MTWQQFWVTMAAFFGGLWTLVYLVLRYEKKRANTWQDVAEGEFDHAEYGDHEYWESRRSGAMVHTTTRHKRRIDLTIVYFSDGRTVVLKGRFDMEHPKGARLTVQQNLNGRKRIVAAEPL